MFTGPFAHPGLRVGSLSFRVSRTDLSVRDGTGKLTGVQLGTPLWMATAELEAITDDEALNNEALIDSAKGSSEQFVVTDPRRWYPKAYPLGTGFTATAGGFSVDTTGTILDLTGLSVGQVITATDYVGFKNAGDTKRHIVRVLAGDTADGSGAAQVTVYPAVWPNVVAWSGVVAHFDKPGVTMKLTDGTSVGDTTPDGRSVCQLVALQYLWD